MSRLVSFLLFVLAFVVPVAAQAAPPVPSSGTITLLTASPALNQVVSFEYTVEGHESKYLRIMVLCSQPVSASNPDGTVYGTSALAAHPTTFLMGQYGPNDGPSEWQQVGGPADCEATLYYSNPQHPSLAFIPLATVAFQAGW